MDRWPEWDTPAAEHTAERSPEPMIVVADELRRSLKLVAQIGTASNQELTCEAGGLLSFCHEAKEVASVVERNALESTVWAVSGTEAAQGWAWPPLDLEPCVPGRDFVGAGDRSPVARSSRRVPSVPLIVLPRKNTGRFLTVVDFVAVKAPKSHKVQRGLAGTR